METIFTSERMATYNGEDLLEASDNSASVLFLTEFQIWGGKGEMEKVKEIVKTNPSLTNFQGEG